MVFSTKNIKVMKIKTTSTYPNLSYSTHSKSMQILTWFMNETSEDKNQINAQTNIVS